MEGDAFGFVWGVRSCSVAINDFFSQFTGIQCQVDWATLLAVRPSVTVFDLDDREKLGSYFTPWRAKLDGSYADGNVQDAIPLRINTRPFPQQRESEIRHDVSNDVVGLPVPCYDLGNAGFLILDGNHRLVSLYRSKVCFKLSIWAIQGPICHSVLPDLACWQS